MSADQPLKQNLFRKNVQSIWNFACLLTVLQSMTCLNDVHCKCKKKGNYNSANYGFNSFLSWNPCPHMFNTKW